MAAEDGCSANENEESTAVAPVAVARLTARATAPVAARAPSLAEAEAKRLRDGYMTVPSSICGVPRPLAKVMLR